MNDSEREIRVLRDRHLAAIRQPDEIKPITSELLARSRAKRARSFVLTGSTALEARTHVSDLDFYIVGPKPALPESEEELDVYSISEDEFRWRILAGDDYAHWTVRFGLVLHDLGPIDWAARKISQDRLWPDPFAKAAQAKRAVQLAVEILRTGDHDAAVEQARIAFSLTARWKLLLGGVFPLARSQLPAQLGQIDCGWLGETLNETIVGDPADDELLKAATEIERELQSATETAPPPVSPVPAHPGVSGGTRGHTFAQLSRTVFGRELTMQQAADLLGIDARWDRARSRARTMHSRR